MKKTTLQVIAIVITALLVCLADNVFSQNVTKDQAGNFIAIAKAKSKAKPTGKTFTDKDGKSYPVMISENGKLFVIRTSAKTGNNYNYYLKLD